MSRFEVRATLTNAVFPFYSAELAHTVMVSQNNQELNRIPLRNFDGAEAENSYGIPQAFYLQNVLPSTRGYYSVSFNQIVKPIPYQDNYLLANSSEWLNVNLAGDYLLVTAAFAGTIPELDDIYIIRDTTSTVDQLAVYSPAGGFDLVYNPDAGGWDKFESNPGFSGLVTVAQVQGKNYIYYQGIGCYTYNFTTNTLDPVTLTGLTAANIKGICSGGLYLVAYDNETLYWGGATPGTVTDFTPSLITGAGSSNLLGSRSPITVALPLADGFVVYSQNNAIGASYSGNEVSPWIFREIPGSSGVLEPRHVTYESNFDFHITWSTHGFQQVSFRKAELIWPELSDVLAKGVYSKRNEVTGEIETLKLVSSSVKLSSIGSRNTIVSVKNALETKSYPTAFVYDWSNARWGRMEVNHRGFFTYLSPTLASPTTYDDLLTAETTYDFLNLDGTLYTDWDPAIRSQGFGETFGMIQIDGSIYSVTGNLDTDYQPYSLDVSGAATPCVYLGKYKLLRGKSLILQELQVDSDFSGVVKAYNIDTSGDIVDTKVVVDEQYSSLENRYLTRFYGDSIAVSLEGDFNLTNLLLTFSGGGSRNAPRR